MSRLPNPLKVFKKNSGVALLMVITTIAIVAFICVELGYDSRSEYIIAAHEVDRMKARYAAKAGVEMALLRVAIFSTAQTQFGSMLGNNKSMLDKIWQMPVIWSPDLFASVGLEKSAVDEIKKDSLMGETTYNTTITSESSKIDLNDLASPSKALRDTTRDSLVRLIENRLNEDDDWARDHRDTRASEIINNIIDWMDYDNISLNNGDESNFYKVDDAKLPPNQPFKTLEELHMVAGVTDDIYNLIAPQVTIYGVKAIQVNYTTKEVLMGIAPVITSDVVDRIMERRSAPEKGGPFKDQKDFLEFLSGVGINTQQLEGNLPPLLFDSESNFRIESMGQYGQTSSEIIAIVYDFDKVKEKLTESLKNDKNKNAAGGGNPGSNTGPTTGGTTGSTTGDGGQPNNQNQQQAPKGRPNVVYWTES